MKKVLAICGSIKNTSANYTLLKTIQSLATDRLNIEIYNELATLPYFDPNPDMENSSEAVVTFRKKIETADGILICTPEYVFSLPGILKNALEWTVSSTVFTDKPAALITASSLGKTAHDSLVLVMKTLGVKTSEDSCLLIQSIKSKMTSEGVITDEATNKQVIQLIEAFDKLMSA